MIIIPLRIDILIDHLSMGYFQGSDSGRLFRFDLQGPEKSSALRKNPKPLGYNH
jgi:hypothetical protein